MGEPIRILHVLGNTQLGGAESRIMDLYRHIDKNRVQFDFLVHSDAEGYFEQEILQMGGRIYRVPRFKLYNYLTYKKALREFFKRHHEFKAVQGHITSTAAVYLPIAKREGISITIAHARSAGVDKGLKGVLTRIMRSRLSHKTDFMFACSELAGISVFGKKAVNAGKTVWIPNAIDCETFVYDGYKRDSLRKELGIEKKYVIGHVGRFHYAKNHEYLLSVFAGLCEKSTGQANENRDYCLLLLGEGGGMEQAKARAVQLGISERVMFLGSRDHIEDYYQAMDYFVYPSRFEGLPGTIVEAQCTGLKCLMSDSITEEAVATELVRTMSLKQTPQDWAQYIGSTSDYIRKSHVELMQAAGFDVKDQAQKMTEFYETGKGACLYGK